MHANIKTVAVQHTNAPAAPPPAAVPGQQLSQTTRPSGQGCHGVGCFYQGWPGSYSRGGARPSQAAAAVPLLLGRRKHQGDATAARARAAATAWVACLGGCCCAHGEGMGAAGR